MREATALGTYVGICNPAMMQEYHRAPVQKRNKLSLKSAPWPDVLVRVYTSLTYPLLPQGRAPCGPSNTEEWQHEKEQRICAQPAWLERT